MTVSESDMYKKAAKGAVMVETNPRVEHNAMDVEDGRREGKESRLADKKGQSHLQKGTAEEDFERVPSGLTKIDAGAIRGVQVTMMANMVSHAEDEVVRDTGHDVVVDTHDARRIPLPLRRRLE